VESEGVLGSSTICLLTINKAVGRLQAATLGDSGMFVIGRRPGSSLLQVKFRTPQQEHEFGRPYQLGHFAHANNPDVRGTNATRGAGRGRTRHLWGRNRFVLGVLVRG
jgi:protein phosphatase PTC7